MVAGQVGVAQDDSEPTQSGCSRCWRRLEALAGRDRAIEASRHALHSAAQRRPDRSTSHFCQPCVRSCPITSPVTRAVPAPDIHTGARPPRPHGNQAHSQLPLTSQHRASTADAQTLHPLRAGQAGAAWLSEARPSGSRQPQRRGESGPAGAGGGGGGRGGGGAGQWRLGCPLPAGRGRAGRGGGEGGRRRGRRREGGKRASSPPFSTIFALQWTTVTMFRTKRDNISPSHQPGWLEYIQSIYLSISYPILQCSYSPRPSPSVHNTGLWTFNSHPWSTCLLLYLSLSLVC